MYTHKELRKIGLECLESIGIKGLVDDLYSPELLPFKMEIRNNLADNFYNIYGNNWIVLEGEHGENSIGWVQHKLVKNKDIDENYKFSSGTTIDSFGFEEGRGESFCDFTSRIVDTFQSSMENTYSDDFKLIQNTLLKFSKSLDNDEILIVFYNIENIESFSPRIYIKIGVFSKTLNEVGGQCE
jgi:hypothetical protein